MNDETDYIKARIRGAADSLPKASKPGPGIPTSVWNNAPKANPNEIPLTTILGVVVGLGLAYNLFKGKNHG